ncbi:hypothetical protein [Promicromonospora sp. NFX87]|uniref:hypothetical protein n=1 Tax=Promicromonospora sp. NFX87 TaxID=3402691 RepID=UPI003AFA726F
MIPIWVTIVVAVLSTLGALGAQWLNGRQSDRRVEIEQRAKREERLQQHREETNAAFLIAARSFQRAIRSASSIDAGDDALNSLRDTATYIELNAPELADGPLASVLDAAVRLHDLVIRNAPTAPAVQEADAEFRQALGHLVELMRDNLGTGDRL